MSDTEEDVRKMNAHRLSRVQPHAAALRRVQLIAVHAVSFLILTATLPAPPAGYRDFELVESVPVETTLDNPDIRNTHDVWLDLISGARSSLDIEQFYICNKQGEMLDDILSAIEQATARGVRVRVIADSRMYRTYPESVDHLSQVGNISTRIIDFGKIAGGIQHAKFFIVDSATVFLGSQNFDWRALSHIHELGVLIRNREAARFYGDVFELDWRLAEKNDPASISSLMGSTRYMPITIGVDKEPNTTLTFVPTASPKGLIPDSSSWDETHILRLIDSTRNELLLQFLSYSPLARDRSRYNVLDDAIRRAAGRGVKVKMIIADWEKGSPGEKSLKELSRTPNIELRYSAIPDWSGGYIAFGRVEHCKYIVGDGAHFWLGTSNGEKSYFYTSRDVGVVATDTRLGNILRRVFMKSWDSPYTARINADENYSPRKHDGE